MKFVRVLCVFVLATCTVFAAFAQGLPRASQPEEVGFSSERLGRLTSAFKGDVDKGLIPGAVVLIARHGKIAYLEAFGFQDREKKIPMSADAIFRIASMTKPVTSVAIMMLVEEGKIQLYDPVSVYLPELKGLQVGVEKINAAGGNTELSLEPAQREMTIQDLFLLRHTSGLTYGIFGKSLVKQAYLGANLFDSTQTLSSRSSRSFRLLINRGPLGTTACRSTSWGASWRLFPARAWTSSSPSGSPNRWDFPIPASMSPPTSSGASPSRRPIRRPGSGRPSPTSRASPIGPRAAAAWYRPRPTTRASARCCSMAAHWMACGYCHRASSRT
jgi:beta-lactamase family protein